jgi:hypothetical protein
MIGACGMHGEMENAYNISVGYVKRRGLRNLDLNCGIVIKKILKK